MCPARNISNCDNLLLKRHLRLKIKHLHVLLLFLVNGQEGIHIQSLSRFERIIYFAAMWMICAPAACYNQAII